MNAQNFQNKFCTNPLEPLFTEGFTKLTFRQYILVQNCKKPKGKNICLQMSTLYNALKFFMHVHILFSSSCKKFHNYFLLRIISRI
jgi:hypothetical protein